MPDHGGAPVRRAVDFSFLSSAVTSPFVHLFSTGELTTSPSPGQLQVDCH